MEMHRHIILTQTKYLTRKFLLVAVDPTTNYRTPQRNDMKGICANMKGRIANASL